MSWVQLVTAISNDVQARMAAANLPPLVAGKVEIGPQHRPQWEHGAPPRIVMVPMSTSWKVSNPGDRNITIPSNAEHHKMLSARAIWQETKLFEVHVWGVTYVNGSCSPDSDLDWDYAEAMYQILLQSLWVLAPARHRVSAGKWVDSRPGAAVLDTIGREFVFSLEIDTPVLDVTFPFVPSGSTYGTLTVATHGSSTSDNITIITPRV